MANRHETRARELLLPADEARRYVGIMANGLCPDCGAGMAHPYESDACTHARKCQGIGTSGARYDAAQTAALQLRTLRLDSVLLQLSVIRRESGNLDVVADCLDDIARDVKRAIEINEDLRLNRLQAYAE